MKKNNKKTIDKSVSVDTGRLILGPINGIDDKVCFSVCRNCKFWDSIDIGYAAAGTCHRNAPHPYYATYSSCAEVKEKREKGTMVWPETKATNFCGEWHPSDFIEELGEDCPF
jgi:hypothetical protein